MPLSPLTRFLVIGAGPAGLAAAARLRELGYGCVTVLEQEPAVGGKCLSLRDGPYTYDLGANLTTPRYDRIRALADRLGVQRTPTASRRVVSVDPDQPAPQPSLLQRLMLKVLVPLYSLVRSTTGIDRPGYAGLRDSVHLPFRAWLRRHFLGAMEPLFQTLFTSYGYGPVMDLPAAYALKFFDRTHLEAAVLVATGRDVEFTTEFRGGFQGLWEELVTQYGLDVRTSVRVVRITRASGQGAVTARWRTADGQLHRGQFDRLVLACPLQDAWRFMALTEDEEPLFGRIETFDYWVTVARVSGLPDVSTYVLPYANQIQPGWPTVFYRPVGGEPGVVVAYAYGGPNVDEQVVVDRLAETVSQPAIGPGRLEEVLTTKHWRYFPHVKDSSDGFYDVLDLLQGRDSTWYVGEVASFTLVELVWEHARSVVDRMVSEAELTALDG